MKRNGFTGSVLILVAVMFIASCGQKSQKNGKPRSIGNTSEILVVVQNEGEWDNMIGKTIREKFGHPQYGLPQDEPLFKLSHIKASSFNDMFQKHRNILIINIDKKAKKEGLELSKDLWAKPQRVFKVSAHNAETAVQIIKKNSSGILSEFNQAERERIMTVFRPDNDLKVVKKVMNKFGLRMTIPQGFYVAKSEPGFMWIRKEAASYSQGVVIISVPYKDTTQFSLKSIMARTDQYLRQYVPGPTEGSWMTTDEKNMPPKAVVVNDFLTDYAVEIRGLWRVEHDFMGGPFVSYTFVDWRKNQIVTMFGYVYKPNKPKRNLLRQVEAIIYSSRFADTGKK